MQYVFVGDSWAAKGYSEHNWHLAPGAHDRRLADYWNIDYRYVDGGGGQGNLNYITCLQNAGIDSQIPILWIWTEPGRDYGIITGKNPYSWLEDDEEFLKRTDLTVQIMQRIRDVLPNPIALIGGLSDVDSRLANELGFTVIHPSWQNWICKKIDYVKDHIGWGSCDILWRMKTKDVKRPARLPTIKSMQWMEWHEQAHEKGYMVMYHPTVLANQEFADDIKVSVNTWLETTQ